MRKLSNIDESMWGGVMDRSAGRTTRNEDYNEFREEFEKIKKMELIEGYGSRFLWTPCNFGAESYDQPGRYLDYEEIIELNKYLKSTGSDYEIAGDEAFSHLIGRPFTKEKRGKWWYFIFSWNKDNSNPLYIPNFGYYSMGKMITPTKSDAFYYGMDWMNKSAGYVVLRNPDNYLTKKIYTLKPTSEDKLQVRLVKRIS